MIPIMCAWDFRSYEADARLENGTSPNAVRSLIGFIPSSTAPQVTTVSTRLEENLGLSDADQMRILLIFGV